MMQSNNFFIRQVGLLGLASWLVAPAQAQTMQERLRTAEHDLAQAERESAEMSQRLAQHRQAAADLSHHLDRIRQEAEARRKEHFERLRSVAALGNRVSALESALEEAVSRVLGALAAHLTAHAHSSLLSRPPRFEAYREFFAGR